MSDAGAQYEWSIGAGTLFRDNFGARAYKYPVEAAAKVHRDAKGGGTLVQRSRLYKEVRPFDMRIPGGKDPLGPDRLYPQGIALAKVASDFVAGAAARHPHPGDRVKSQCAVQYRRRNYLFESILMQVRFRYRD